jgi:transposase
VFVRKVTNKSGNISIQVVKKINRQNKIIKHIGTARSEKEKQQLSFIAHQFIDRERIKSGVISFFDNRFEKPKLEQLLAQLTFHRSLNKLTYLFLAYFYRQLKFASFIEDSCFQDLVIARIVYPCSRRKTKKILKTRFGKTYPLNKIYQTMKTAFDKNYRGKIKKTIYRFISRSITENTSDLIAALFFDVTTLYYEAFDEDDFRKCGYSKDGKNNQPQILVALTVTTSGMPLTLHSFEGNKFEGHTILPCILDLIDRFKIRRRNFIVVADAAMLSAKNLELLEENKIKYIVGARLGNLKEKIFNEVVEKITKIDGSTIRISLDNNDNGKSKKSYDNLKNGGKILVVSYSTKRASKDKSDREKQLNKAKQALSSGSPTKRYKYLSAVAKGKYQINENLIEKSLKLEGLKGYVTNAVNLTNDEIIQKYSDLWLVEKAFRMSKFDLKARPIFSTVRQSIEAHLTLVFTALIISRHIEIVSKKTIAYVIDTLNEVEEIPIEDDLTGEKTTKSTSLTDEAKELIKLTKIRWVT